MDRAAFDSAYHIRTDGQMHMAPLNLDDMPDSDLSIAANHPALHHDVRLYAGRIIEARSHRLAGDIPTAMRIEVGCDWLYERMPRSVRW